MLSRQAAVYSESFYDTDMYVINEEKPFNLTFKCCVSTLVTDYMPFSQGQCCSEWVAGIFLSVA